MNVARRNLKINKNFVRDIQVPGLLQQVVSFYIIFLRSSFFGTDFWFAIKLPQKKSQENIAQKREPRIKEEKLEIGVQKE